MDIYVKIILHLLVIDRSFLLKFHWNLKRNGLLLWNSCILNKNANRGTAQWISQALINQKRAQVLKFILLSIKIVNSPTP